VDERSSCAANPMGMFAMVHQSDFHVRHVDREQLGSVTLPLFHSIVRHTAGGTAAARPASPRGTGGRLRDIMSRPAASPTHNRFVWRVTRVGLPSGVLLRSTIDAEDAVFDR
jgi:hypothetical protein